MIDLLIDLTGKNRQKSLRQVAFWLIFAIIWGKRAA